LAVYWKAISDNQKHDEGERKVTRHSVARRPLLRGDLNVTAKWRKVLIQFNCKQ